MPNRLKGLGSRVLRDGVRFTEVLHVAHAAGPKRSSRDVRVRGQPGSSGPHLMDLQMTNLNMMDPHTGPPPLLGFPLLGFPLLLKLVISTMLYA